MLKEPLEYKVQWDSRVIKSAVHEYSNSIHTYVKCWKVLGKNLKIVSFQKIEIFKINTKI
jgi:hypothetical protein